MRWDCVRIASLRHAAVVPILVVSSVLLQGCSQFGLHKPRALHRSQGTSLLQVPGTSRKRQHEAVTSRPIEDEQPQAPSDDEQEEAPLAYSTSKKPDWGVLLQEEDTRQQDELKDQYQQMLNMNDPDQVDKAIKAAWSHMQQEDQHFTRAMQHTVKTAAVANKPVVRSGAGQRSDRLFAAFGSEKLAEEALHPQAKHRHRKLMLNQRSTSTHHSKASGASHSPGTLGHKTAPPLDAIPSALDAEAAVAMRHIVRALAMEKATFVHQKNTPLPDGPGEGPGRYGVCCDRSKNCDCNGKPSEHASGLFGIGSKMHHDRFHEVTGEEPPLPPTTEQAALSI